jgi:excisionase family DNA binding protein
MPRPPLKSRAASGLTSTEVAKQLGCSPSYVRKLQGQGYFPKVKDGSGVYRFNPHDVAEVARKLGRVVKTDGEVAALVYGYFLEPGFQPTPKQIARVVHETKQHPDVILALWDRFKAGVGSPANDAEEREVDRISREYDEQIAAMDEELVRKRRAAFIPGDPRKDAASR